MLHELNSQRATDSLDVVFMFPNESDRPAIQCHSLVLKSKSPYFEGLLNFPGNFTNPDQGIKTITVENFTHTSI